MTAPSLLSPEHIAMVDRGVSVIVASRDAAFRPSIMRGVGSAISAILFTGCAGDTVMTAIDYMYQPGGPL